MPSRREERERSLLTQGRARPVIDSAYSRVIEVGPRIVTDLYSCSGTKPRYLSGCHVFQLDGNVRDGR